MPLRIRLFGELDVRVGDEPGAPLESARARTLLAYLLLHEGVAQSRQRLAFLLWPDSTEGQARTNLRHLLHTLRSTVPAAAPYLDVTPQTIRWHGEGQCWTDVAAFDAALARAADAEPAGDDELAALGDAVGHYAGDLVDGCYDDWLLPERDRYRDRYTWAVRRLAGLLAGRGDHAEAARLGRELLRIDPLREDTYRLLMRVHDAAGDRAAAVRTYHECVSTLRRELGVEPSEATREAYAALMRQDREAPAVSGAALVGREAEWRRLVACWEAAERGQARLVLISGEPGIGKTRLVEDFAAWCGHHGAMVAAARAYPSEGELGYGVVQAWLRAPALAGHLRRLPERDRAEVARLLPELGPAGPEGADAAEQRRRLFEAAARALVAPPGRPALLVADDAHWCDGPSLQLLHYLVRLEPSPSLLVVATVRREDLGADHPLTGLIAGLQGIDRVTEVALDRLDREATAELARRLAGRPLGPDDAGSLHAETEGNPLFIVETLRAGWDRSAISPRLQSVITARLRQVSEPAQALLGLAATVGREFTTGVLAAASPLDDLSLVRALDELWRRGLVREQGTDAYDFTHGRIRDVVYDALAPAERRHNHVVIAGALAGDPSARAGDVARHYQHAGRPGEAVTWYRRAAVEAQRLHAYPEAVRLLDRALELAGGADEMAVLAALPTPLSVVEGFASPRLAEVQRRLLGAGADPEPELLRSLVMSNLCRRDFDAARTLATRLRESAAGDEVLLVESEYLLGISAFWAGDFNAARRHFETVDEKSDAARRAEHLLRFGQDARPVCVSRLANTLRFLGEVDEAVATADRALAMAEELGHRFTAGVVCVFAALLAVDMDDPERYGGYLDRLPDATGQQALEAAAEALRGFADVLAGHPEAGIPRIRAAVGQSSVDHAPGQQATHLHLLVRAHEVARDAAGGLEAVEEALAASGTRIWDGDHRRARRRFQAALAEER